jgi:hypothetical protein
MSIIENAERLMKRYDYLMEKREHKHNQGKRLTPQEDEELQKLRPNVFTPILVMFELLHDTVKTNQTLRKSKEPARVQSGGTDINHEKEWEPPSSAAAAAAAAAASAAAAAAAGSVIIKPPPPTVPPEASAPPLDADDDNDDDDADAKAKEAGRLSELEESLLPLLSKIIVYIEQNKKKEKKKDDEDEEEKYPDIGTTAKNSAILVIRRIKKWWNDLIQGGTSDLSSKINLRKAIPQLADNSTDMNKLNEMADKATEAIHDPLQKIAKILSNDVRDIASSSVEGIMNALSLIPGIGTTLQLWRLLQNVVVIMSKSVTTMAGAKTEGVALKTNIMGLKDELAGDAMNMAQGAAKSAATSAAGGGGGGGMPGMPAGMPEMPAGMPEMPAGMPGMPAGMPEMPAGMPGMPAGMPGMPAGAADLAKMMPAGAADLAKMIPGGAIGKAALNKAANMTGMGGALDAAKMAGKFLSGGAKPHTTNHLRSIKKYKREYKQSIREIRKTRKKMMKYIRNII